MDLLVIWGQQPLTKGDLTSAELSRLLILFSQMLVMWKGRGVGVYQSLPPSGGY